MPLNHTQLAQIMPALRGAPLSVLVTFLLSEPQAFGSDLLATIIGYSRSITRQALQTLSLQGLTQNLTRYNGWVLTSNAKQLFLMEQIEGKNFTFPLSSSSRSYILQKEEDLTLKEETTTTTQTQAEGKNFTLPLEDEYIQEIVQYFQQNGIPQKAYQGALQNALNEWSTQRTNTAFKLWLHFAEDEKHNINVPAFYIIARLRDLDPPPINERSPCLFCTSAYEQHLHQGPICSECGGCRKCCTCNHEGGLT